MSTQRIDIMLKNPNGVIFGIKLIITYFQKYLSIRSYITSFTPIALKSRFTLYTNAIFHVTFQAINIWTAVSSVKFADNWASLKIRLMIIVRVICWNLHIVNSTFKTWSWIDYTRLQFKHYNLRCLYFLKRSIDRFFKRLYNLQN